MTTNMSSDQPQKKSGLRVEMDIAQGNVQGLAQTGKFEPGHDASAGATPGIPGEGGQSNYAEQLPDQYHPATDVGDPGTGWRDTGAGIAGYKQDAIPGFGFGQGARNSTYPDTGKGAMATGPEYGVGPSFSQQTPEETGIGRISGNQSTQGGSFVANKDPDALQPGKPDYDRSQFTITGPVNVPAGQQGQTLGIASPGTQGAMKSGVNPSAGSSGLQPTINMPGVMNPPLSGSPGVNASPTSSSDADSKGVAGDAKTKAQQTGK